MTAISTILAIIMLPLNLAIYTPLIFKGEDDVKVTEMLDFSTLVTSICVVFGAIGAGIMASVKIDNHNFHIFANRVSCVICVCLVRCLLVAYLTHHFSCISICIAWKCCWCIARHAVRYRLKRRRWRHKDMGTRCQILLRCCITNSSSTLPKQRHDHICRVKEARACHFLH